MRAAACCAVDRTGQVTALLSNSRYNIAGKVEHIVRPTAYRRVQPLLWNRSWVTGGRSITTEPSYRPTPPNWNVVAPNKNVVVPNVRPDNRERAMQRVRGFCWDFRGKRLFSLASLLSYSVRWTHWKAGNKSELAGRPWKINCLNCRSSKLLQKLFGVSRCRRWPVSSSRQQQGSWTQTASRVREEISKTASR